jgi:hypothetical protein
MAPLVDGPVDSVEPVEHPDEDDPGGAALDALKSAGLIPRPISGWRSGEFEGHDGVGILEHVGPLSAEDRERIRVVMGELPYVLDELIRDPGGTRRRAVDGRVLSRPFHPERRDAPDR